MLSGRKSERAYVKSTESWVQSGDVSDCETTDTRVFHSTTVGNKPMTEYDVLIEAIAETIDEQYDDDGNWRTTLNGEDLAHIAVTEYHQKQK